MIALDTNVLLRLFVSDNADQAMAARRLMVERGDAPGSVYVGDVTLAEFVWVLSTRVGWPRQKVLSTIDALLSDPRFTLDDRDVIETAILAASSGKADFADYLIAARARARGAITTFTFDVDAAREPGFAPIPV